MEENRQAENKAAETKKENWAEKIEISMPLSEYNKLMKKIAKLKKQRDEADRKYWNQLHAAMNAEEALKRLKADYQKALGISDEGGKQE